MVMLGSDVIEDQIRQALAKIHDPCSIAAGRPLSLIEMGLVRGWTLTEGTLSITFCVTFAGCTMAPHFVEAAARDLASIPGIARVVTIIDTDFVWTPEMMTASPFRMAGRPQAWRYRPGVLRRISP